MFLAMMTYLAAAALLGAGWFLVLCLTPMTREWLVADLVQNLVLLVVTSVVVALAFRKFIASADTFRGHVLRAMALPYVGCVVFLSLAAGSMWLETMVFGGLASLHDTVSLYVMGLSAALIAFIVVVPYGLICQYVMSAIAERGLSARSGRGV